MSKIVELKDEETKQVSGGATAIQYGLISAAISLVKLPTLPVSKSGVGVTPGSSTQAR